MEQGDNTKQIYIVRCGEVALKGQNKPYFERMLAERIKRMLRGFQGIEIKRSEGLIFVRADRANDQEEVKKELSKVFGVASISPAVETAPEMEAIYESSISYMQSLIEQAGIKTFKVEAKRANKQFPLRSPDIARSVGARALVACPTLKVDVHQPQCMLHVDVRRDAAYLYHEKIPCFGGLPLGTNGKGMVLLSGGIDSPVSAFMMAKRGMRIEAVHFHAYPYTSERAQQKVEDLAKIIASYCGRFRVHCVNLLEIQQAIAERCPQEEMTILTRRFMMKIAERLAVQKECDVLVTGENMGQVASQTIHGLVVTDDAVTLPVMRPLIALDKVDIIEVAQRIGTFETSIQPFEDCCTVFLPKHPVTRPRLDRIKKSETFLDCEALIAAAMQTLNTIEISEE